jgi:hypothetical protein
MRPATGVSGCSIHTVVSMQPLGFPLNGSAIPQPHHIPEGTIIYAFGFGTIPEHSKPSGGEAIEPANVFGKGNREVDICLNLDEVEDANNSLRDSDNDTTPFTANAVVLTPLTCQGLGIIINSLVRIMDSSVRRLFGNK